MWDKSASLFLSKGNLNFFYSSDIKMLNETLITAEYIVILSRTK